MMMMMMMMQRSKANQLIFIHFVLFCPPKAFFSSSSFFYFLLSWFVHLFIRSLDRFAFFTQNPPISVQFFCRKKTESNIRSHFFQSQIYHADYNWLAVNKIIYQKREGRKEAENITNFTKNKIFLPLSLNFAHFNMWIQTLAPPSSSSKELKMFYSHFLYRLLLLIMKGQRLGNYTNNNQNSSERKKMS